MIENRQPEAASNAGIARVGALAGVIAGPFFLGAILLNTWASHDFLHSLGWKLFGGKDLPYPSTLALGPHGWAQVMAFATTGLLLVAFSAAFRRSTPSGRLIRVGTWLATLMGVLVAASAFRTDRGMVAGHDPTTWNGWVHGLAFVLLLPTISLACTFLGIGLARHKEWRSAGWASLAAVPLLAASLFLGPHGQASFLLFLAILFAWVAALSLRMLGTPRRPSALAVPVVAAIVALICTATAAGATPQIIRLVAVDIGPGTSTSNIDLERPGKLDVGDGFTETNGLFDGKRRVGRLELSCTILRILNGNPVNFHCSGVVYLPAGQLTVFGPLHGPKACLAITGGTGRYAGARGEARLRLINEHHTAWAFRLLG